MKKLTISTKLQAEMKAVETLFVPGGTATKKIRYDMGKYKGTAHDYYGRDVDVLDGVVAIWPETRRDRSGSYVVFWCYTR